MSMNTIFAKSRELPHIPKVIQELVASFQQTEIDVDDISNKVSLDQALTAKVLRLANSAHYGVSRNVTSPHDAVLLLGFDTLRTMVLASGMTSVFKTTSDFDQNEFWRRAFNIGALSKWLAPHVPDCDPDTAFTCGMLHSIGSLLIRIVMPKEAESLDKTEKLGGNRYSLETGLLGFNYADVGAELARRWHFPEIMQNAISQQHGPDTEADYEIHAGVIYLAKYLHHARDNGWDDSRIAEEFPLQVAQQLRMQAQSVISDLPSLHHLSSGMDGLLE